MSGLPVHVPTNKSGSNPPQAHPLVPSCARPPALTAALEFTAFGWSAGFSCDPQHRDKYPPWHTHSDDRAGKVPNEPWRRWQKEKATPEQLIALHAQYPHSNPIVFTGPISGIGMFDVDNESCRRILYEIFKGTPPPTVEFTTPNGGHRYVYRLPWSSGVNSRSYKAEVGKLDWLYTDKLSVMPPGVGINGSLYAWVPGRAPGQIEIPELSMEVRAFLLKRPYQKRGPGGGNGGAVPTDKERALALRRARGVCRGFRPAVQGEGGHNQLFAVCCVLASIPGLSRADAMDVVMELYAPRCIPPFTDRGEVWHKVSDAWLTGGVRPDPEPRGPHNGHTVATLGEVVPRTLDQVERKCGAEASAGPGLRVVREDDGPAEANDQDDEPEPDRNGKSRNIAQCDAASLNGEASGGELVPECQDDRSSEKVPPKERKRTKKVDSVASDNGVSYRTEKGTPEGGEGGSDKPLSPAEASAGQPPPINATRGKQPSSRGPRGGGRRPDNADQVEPPQPLTGFFTFSSEDVLPAEWFFEPFVPSSLVTLLVGEAGSGKTTFTALLMTKARHTIVFPGEEDVRRTALPRALASGVDPGKLTWVPAHYDWTMPGAKGDLVRLIREKVADLVIFDTLDDYLHDSINENDNLNIRKVLQALREVAEETGAAVVVIRHPGKAAGNVMVASRAWGNHPRAIIRFVKDHDVKDQGTIHAHKPPLGRDFPPTAYNLVEGNGAFKRFQLGSEVDPVKARESLEVADRLDRHRINQTEQWLRGVLADGPMVLQDIYLLADKVKHPERMIQRAAERIGVVFTRSGKGKNHKSTWSLPTEPPASE